MAAIQAQIQAQRQAQQAAQQQQMQQNQQMMRQQLQQNGLIQNGQIQFQIPIMANGQVGAPPVIPNPWNPWNLPPINMNWVNNVGQQMQNFWNAHQNQIISGGIILVGIALGGGAGGDGANLESEELQELQEDAAGLRRGIVDATTASERELLQERLQEVLEAIAELLGNGPAAN